MKITASALFVFVSGLSSRVSEALPDACVSLGFTFEFSGTCSFDNVLAEYTKIFDDERNIKSDCPEGRTAEEDLIIQFNAGSLENAKTKLSYICQGTFDDVEIPFNKIARKGTDFEFERRFYNGATEWNEETETMYSPDSIGEKTNVLREDAKLVKQFYGGSGQRIPVKWPKNLPNFDTCQANAAMCCWARDRQANDNNGNCASPYDSKCYDKDPGDNTDLCYIPLKNGEKSTRFGSSTGGIVFPGDNNDGEGAVHCHGFAWSDDKEHPSARYKANNLFFVSMYDHMYQRGYAENIPGAPMCACVEQMPVVTRSDCTQIDVVDEEAFEFTYDGSNFTARMKNDSRIQFNACRGAHNRNNDLSAYMYRLYLEGMVTHDQYTTLKKALVENGNCPDATRKYFEDLGYTIGYSPTQNFLQVAGRDFFDVPLVGNTEFYKLMGASATLRENDYGIILRVCQSCIKTHQKIYYKRLTSTMPQGFLRKLTSFLGRNYKEHNTYGVDFDLFSTYEDAVAGTNRWECEYNYNVEFPGRCGPDGSVNFQESRFNPQGGRTNVAFYVEVPAGLDLLNDLNDNRSTGLSSVDIGLHVDGATRVDENGRYHVSATTSAGYNGARDSLHYVYEEVDFSDTMTVIVNVMGIHSDGADMKAGIMLRESLDADSEHAFLLLNGNLNMQWMSRQYTGDNIYIRDFSKNQHVESTPTWLMLTKNRNMIEVFRSDDGKHWTELEKGIELPDHFMDSDTIYAGMAVMSFTYSSVEAVFDNWEVSNTASKITCAPVFEDDGTPVVQMY